MGKVRDILRSVGLLSSAGVTLSNTGTRLLDIRNELNRLSKEGASGREKPFYEGRVDRHSCVAAGQAVQKAAARQHARKKAKMTTEQLEKKRRYNRERMRRLRARRKAK